MDVNVEHRSDYLYIHMSGEYGEDIPVEGQPASMAKACRDGNYRCLLIDMRTITNEIISTVCYRQGEEIAKAFAFNVIRIAIVGSTERARSLSIVENVATNHGINLKAFTDIDKATEWLVK
jgi:hypothetical protein